MNKWSIAIIICLSFGILSCGEDGKRVFKRFRFTKRDRSITPKNSFTDQFIDSTQLEQFIVGENIDIATAQHIRSFYNSRNYQFAWFNKAGLNEPGLAFWNLLNSYISASKDSGLFNKTLATSMRDFTDGNSSKDKKSIEQTEMNLTRQFFIYANVAYAGKIDPEELQWFIPRKKVDALALLDSLVARKGETLDQWEPVNPQYQTLKKELIVLNDISTRGGWDTISMSKKSLKPGDNDQAILAVKKRLYASGDLPQFDSSSKYDNSLSDAVKKNQRRFGFKEDGVIDRDLVKALNVPVKQRIEQILINLERMKWLPEKQADNRLEANIPEFKLHVFENNKEAFEMNIVVGKDGHNTVIFNDMLKFIVFSPYWNVPSSVVKKEILPAINRNSNYLARHNMEQTGSSGGLPSIRQKPGGSNSLGRVKFLFPNNYNIYFHDTPAKSLFDREKRAYSHGCIRLSDPVKLANYLLRDDPSWPPEKIDEAMHQSKEKWVTLKKPIPVYISYFTAWVDDEGLLNFRDDIYGHDAKMASRLFIGRSDVDTATFAKE